MKVRTVTLKRVEVRCDKDDIPVVIDHFLQNGFTVERWGIPQYEGRSTKAAYWLATGEWEVGASDFAEIELSEITKSDA